MVVFVALSDSCSPAAVRYDIELNGKSIGDLGGLGVHSIVLVFAATDRPISNRYVPESNPHPILCDLL
jgi:hypothetical protein